MDELKAIANAIRSAGGAVENADSINELAKKPAYDALKNADYAFVNYVASGCDLFWKAEVLNQVDCVMAFLRRNGC